MNVIKTRYFNEEWYWIPSKTLGADSFYYTIAALQR